MNSHIGVKIDNATVGVALLVSNDYRNAKDVRWHFDENIHEDADKLEELLKNLGYVVYKRKNVDKSDFKSCCKDLAEFNYPVSCQRLLVYFSGHGNDGKLFMQDRKELIIKKVVSLFKPSVNEDGEVDKEYLALMVRMFFFDACRGEKIDSGFPFVTVKVPLSKEITCLRSLPIEGNMLIAYASTRKYVAHTDSKLGGSRWTNCLVEALQESKETDSIGSVLTMANGKLSRIDEDDSIQTATFTSSLRSDVFLKQEAIKRARECSGEF